MLSVSNYQYLLQNPFYYGLIRYNGEYFEGKHEPIITKKLFDEVQEVMKRKSKPQKVDKMKFFLYRGFFKCGKCGFTITADRKIKPSGKQYVYYYCTKKNPNHQCDQNVFTKEEKISFQVREAIQKVSLPDDCADWMLAELRKEQKEKTQSSRFFAQKTEEDIKTIDEKLEKLMNAYLESALNLAEYRETKNILVNQKQLLKDKLRAFEQKSNNRFELAKEFIKASKEAKNIALQENPVTGRDFLKKIGSNFLIQDQNISFSPRGAWRILCGRAFGARRAPVVPAAGGLGMASKTEIFKMRRGRDSNSRTYC